MYLRICICVIWHTTEKINYCLYLYIRIEYLLIRREKNIKETDSLNLSKSNNVNRMDKFHMKYRVRKKSYC